MNRKRAYQGKTVSRKKASTLPAERSVIGLEQARSLQNKRIKPTTRLYYTNDHAEETNGGGEDLNDKDFDEQHRTMRIGQRCTGADYTDSDTAYQIANAHLRRLVVLFKSTYINTPSSRRQIACSQRRAPSKDVPAMLMLC